MCGCNKCRACKERARRKENPELYRERDRARYWKDRDKRLAAHKEWRELNKEKAYKISRKALARLEVIKTKNPCMDCGNRFPPECIDFDHRNPNDKVAGVGHMIASRWSWAKIEAEIAKCDIVCANCHRIRTKKRFQEKREQCLSTI